MISPGFTAFRIGCGSDVVRRWTPPPIVALTQRQLDAYNVADLDAFCACYHADVSVMMGEEVVATGIDALRARCAAKFASGGFGATVRARLLHGSHCVDDEQWWVRDPNSGEEKSGVLLVHYVECEWLIGRLQFLG